jgi:hypothetical protein
LGLVKKFAEKAFMHLQRLVDEYRGCVENSGNQRGVTTLRTEGTQMGRISSGTLSGDLHQAVLVNPSRPLNWNVKVPDKGQPLDAGQNFVGIGCPIAWRTIQAMSVAIHRAARAISPDAASGQTSGRRSAPDKPSAGHEIEPRLSIAPRLEEQEQQSVDAAAG